TSEQVDGARVELERALVGQLLEDVLLDRVDRTLRVHEVVMENLLERAQRVPRLLLERLVAPARQRLVDVGGALLEEGADARPPHFLVVRGNLAAALQLPRD